MPFYAQVVVVDAPTEDAAHELLTHPEGTMPYAFVGDPWEVEPENRADARAAEFATEFDTADCIGQRPDA